MRVLVVDYGMGNLASARRGFEEGGADVLVSSDPAAIADAGAIVVPGVGAFGQAMDRLNGAGWSDALRGAAADGKPILGVCLGMQLLAGKGEEGGHNEGLGLIPGTVRRLVPEEGERVPHVGWNAVDPADGEPLFAGIPDGADFYFVHSFQFQPDDPAHVVATTPYAGGVVAAVRLGRVAGTQFHPEKSSRVGLQLIRNFLAEARG
ncbi:MAG TPA: imidazole glycerol phosphate synthase subunit HisH [Allosphingosinicella sp.]|nr:imidazole glycerol phosphate synthase subunit HisH [Allosphingosinicella sp.]